jgi:hypothetical protein
MLAKSGLVDREFFLELYSGDIMLMWDLLSEYTAITREAGGSGLWENFEYSAVLSQDWMAQHPSGTYLANVVASTCRTSGVTPTWRMRRHLRRSALRLCEARLLCRRERCGILLVGFEPFVFEFEPSRADRIRTVSVRGLKITYSVVFAAHTGGPCPPLQASGIIGSFGT